MRDIETRKKNKDERDKETERKRVTNKKTKRDKEREIVIEK